MQMGHIDSIAQMDLLELEFGGKWAEFRRLIVHGNCNSTIDDLERQYRCFRIEGTPLTLGFVFNKNRKILGLKDNFDRPEDITTKEELNSSPKLNAQKLAAFFEEQIHHPTFPNGVNGGKKMEEAMWKWNSSGVDATTQQLPPALIGFFVSDRYISIPLSISTIFE